MRRTLVVITLLLAAGALYQRFPYALHDQESRVHFFYLLALLIVITLTSRLIKPGMEMKAVRDGTIWIGIFVIILLAYSFKDRLQGELMPQHVRERSDGTIEIKASEGGHFFLEAKVNNANVMFMIDTGASEIALSPDDAERAGIKLAGLTYDHSYSTANGYGSGAMVEIDHLAIGTLSMSHVKASVNKADMDYSLLGMSFLNRLRGFRVEGNTLVLIP